MRRSIVHHSAAHQIRYQIPSQKQLLFELRVVQGHFARCCSLGCEGALFMILYLGLVSDIPFVHWQSLAELTPTVIEKSAYAPQYQVPIYCTLVLQSSCNSRSHPIQMANMLATLFTPCRLLLYLTQCILSQESPVVPVFSRFTWNQSGANGPSESKWDG